MIYEYFVKIRDWIISLFYKHLLKPIFFLMDPEDVHDRMIKVGVFLGKYSILRLITKTFFYYKNPILNQNIFDINYENPIGLSAGFDKNAELINILPAVGFGFVEVGSITGEYCDGNPKPRLWRMPKSESLIVYYGLKNKGAERISHTIKSSNSTIPLGINIAMTNCYKNLEIENGIKDFEKAFKIMKDFGDYLTINISCPNALGGQPFIQTENLERLLTVLDAIETNKKIFIKLSPDLNETEIDKILETLDRHRIHGIICSNLTKNRSNTKIDEEEINISDKGGISGKVVEDLANKLLSYVYKKSNNKYILIGVGGVSSGLDAYNKIINGANLIQMITGMIFEGPQVISQINQELAEILKEKGFKNIKDAIGSGVK